MEKHETLSFQRGLKELGVHGGGIPVLTTLGLGLPEAWENSVKAVIDLGKDAPSQYDRAGDPLTKDCTMVLDVTDPLREPRIHGFFPGGPTDLEEYCMEVIEGVKDHWTRNPEDPEDKRWSYTYHGRMCKDFGVDQLGQMVNKLTEQPYSRQVQFTTWMPKTDPVDYDPPCLQRGWCRVLEGADGQLEMTAHVFFRSRDALKAAFMNAYAFVRLFDEKIRIPLQRALDAPIHFARYVDISDSYHIYGKDLKDDIERFFSCFGKRYWYDLDNEPWKGIMEDSRAEVAEKIRKQDKNRGG